MTYKHNNKIGKRSLNLKADFQYLRQQNYDVIKEIGRGSYGVVYKAEDYNTSGFCAIKINFNIITRQQLYIEMGLLNLMREKRRLPYLHRIIENNRHYSIIMDYHKSKSFITFFNRIQLKEVKHYLLQLLLGLKQLKQLGIYHRDIKPSNFLYDQTTKRGVIVDYGLAQIDDNFVLQLQERVQQCKQCSEEQQYEMLYENLQIYKNIQKCLGVIGKNKIGTEIFMPPQSILRVDNQTYSSDIWPVGVIFLQFSTYKFNIFTNFQKLQQYFNLNKNSYSVCFLLQLGSLFGKDYLIEVCQKKFGYQLILPEVLRQINLRQICVIPGFDDTAYDLLIKMLEIDPDKRISVQEAIQHPFFDQVRDQHA